MRGRAGAMGRQLYGERYTVRGELIGLRSNLFGIMDVP
jgi:hypothetical protein